MYRTYIYNDFIVNLFLIWFFTLTHYSPALLFYTPVRGDRKALPGCNGFM